ncbi:MAG: hypothetical protein RMK61_03490 [Bacteroidota bacterium]|nr:hypothetical protein [Bacteroidota bacterium]MDW8137498.1 hypothetical protein [Bacteroidota bacterium]
MRELLKRVACALKSSSWSRWASALFLWGAIGLSLYHLGQLGWEKIAAKLPTSPWFYGLFLVLYLSLPLSELWVYRRLWRFPLREGLRAFLVKKVYNRDLLGYSGEAYLLFWAQRVAGVSPRQAWLGVKDNNLLSALISSITAVGILLALLLSDATLAGRLLPRADRLSWAACALGLLLLGAIAYRFRRVLFQLPRRVLLELAGVHTGRLILVHALTVCMWWAGAPEVPLRGWLTLLALDILSARLPALPGKDVLVMNLQIALAGSLALPAAAVAALFLAQTALDKLLNVLVLLLQVGNLSPRGAFKGAQASASETHLA